MNSLPKGLLVLAAALALSACALRGPDAARASRLEYNEAVQVSSQRELLLNLVRLRYLDAPEFLGISGISTQMEFKLGGTISATVGKDEGDHDAFATPGASVSYSESPTITFTPRQDDDFAQDLMTPVDLNAVYLLTQYQWGLNRVLVLVARGINSVGGGPQFEIRRSHTDMTLARVAALFSDLESLGLVAVSIEHRPVVLSKPIAASQISVNDFVLAEKAGYSLKYQSDTSGYVLTGASTHYALRVQSAALSNPKYVELAGLLELPPEQKSYPLSVEDSCCEGGDFTLRVHTRSVLEVLSFLSGGVTVPGEHGSITNTPSDGDGALLRDILRVNTSTERPDSAFLSVPYRGHWFYIDDADTSSRETLALLSALYRLTIDTTATENLPVLTLPVNQ